jgi:Zn-dependent alcohol dehydrogenase
MPKAAVATQIGAPLEVLDVDLQAPKAGEVRVRLGASGVCHSDLSVLNGTLLSPLPSVLGHEGAGIIEELGQGVDNLKVGDTSSSHGCRRTAPATTAGTTRRSCARPARPQP